MKKVVILLALLSTAIAQQPTPTPNPGFWKKWWDDLNKPTLKRVSDEAFISWLVGKRIVTSKGLIFDDYWTIKKGEISAFKFINVTQNPSDQIYTATVSFRATATGRGVEVKGALIRYKEGDNVTLAKFVDFVPVKVAVIGN
ncbi:MAG: hypothetical protein ACOYMN_08265 [Roseimicrobium sp.]